MSLRERRSREKTALRADILDAARHIFVEEGYEALTMRRVAERIEYSPTTIYLYFKDKSELVTALCDETFAGLTRRLQDLAAKHKEPLAYLNAGLRAYIDFGLKHPGEYYVTFIAPRPAHALPPFEGSSGQRAFEFLQRTVASCVANKQIRNVDVDATAQALWASIHGLVALLNAPTGFPFVGRQRLIDAQMDTLLAGLRKH